MVATRWLVWWRRRYSSSDGRDEARRWGMVGGGSCCWDRGHRGAFGWIGVGTKPEKSKVDIFDSIRW